MPSSDVPPSSKKLSMTPTRSRRSAWHHAPAMVSSAGEPGSWNGVTSSGRGWRSEGEAPCESEVTLSTLNFFATVTTAGRS